MMFFDQKRIVLRVLNMIKQFFLLVLTVFGRFFMDPDPDKRTWIRNTMLPRRMRAVRWLTGGVAGPAGRCWAAPVVSTTCYMLGINYMLYVRHRRRI